MRLWLFFIAFFLSIASAFTLWLLNLNQDLNERLKGEWFLPPVEIYSRGMSLTPGLFVSKNSVEGWLMQTGLSASQALKLGHYVALNESDCRASLSAPPEEPMGGCIAFSHKKDAYQLVAFSPGGESVIALFEDQPFQPLEVLSLPPRLFAQFYGEEPILRQVAALGDIPLDCIQAVSAIEDDQFLEHSGISLKGILRGLAGLLSSGRITGGGSTITQQLVKNYFLSSERTFQRKFTEFFMALLLENKISKDEIIQTYLNLIYMGQNGPFQVRGFGAASEHYFGKRLSQLDLPQCALLAAVLNSPGRYNPFVNPENAKARRSLVLKRMLDTKMIDKRSFALADAEPLPQKPPRTMSEPAPYFVQGIHREIKSLGIDPSGGLKVYSTLNEWAQESAQRAFEKQVPLLEVELRKKLKLNPEESLPALQAYLVSLDLETGAILAQMGGRKFKSTQYNRALDGHRQAGSVMKPIVYLAALESRGPTGEPYTPLTMIPDEPFTHRYEGQEWSPHNYDETKSFGKVPLYFALKNSMNIPTARLGLDVGLSSIIEVARRIGIRSPLEPLPSLTLGAFELFADEVLVSYSTLARLGSKTTPHYVQRVESLSGEILYDHRVESEQVLAPDVAAVLVGMLRQTVLSGTARSVTAWRGFTHPSAGKTGTTSDGRDAWFVGFTPKVLAVVWVGFDRGTTSGLTGASGAVPLWTDYMKGFASIYPPEDFSWPEGTEKILVTAEKKLELGIPLRTDGQSEPDEELIFQK